MRIYHPDNADYHTVVAYPAGDTPQVEHQPDWKNQDGSPKAFPVVFKDGVADVPDPLAKYLIDRGIGRKNRPLLKPNDKRL